MKKRFTLAMVILAVFAMVLLAAEPLCPIEGGGAYFTGRITTDVSTGKLMRLYKCMAFGHEFWVVAR